MNYKEFIMKADSLLDNMGVEKLKNCLHNIARKTPENERIKFLQLLEDFYNQNIEEESKESNKKFQYKRLMREEKVKDTLSDIKNTFEKIEDGELCLSAEGYEDYSNGYWASDWIWTYEDNEGISRIIEDAALFGHDCMNDCRYKEAVTVFRLIMDTPITVEEVGGDFFELDLEEMVEENLVGLNLRVLALDVLYSNYQLVSAEKRANALYSYFIYPYFKDIHIEDVFSVGREELDDIDKFLQSWVDLLMQQKGEVPARLLKEAIIYYKGAEGLLEMARKSEIGTLL